MQMSPAIFSAFSTIARGIQLGVLQQRLRRGLRVRAAGTDRDQAVLGFEHVAVAGDDQRGRLVGDREQRLEPAEAALGAPVLGQLDRGAGEIAAVLLELLLEQLEQRERVGGRAGETRPARRPCRAGAPCARWPS